MKDFATSDSPAVQVQLDRLAALSLPQGRFTLDPIRMLCARLGDPQHHLPPVFHVAGTNGKGSTCTFLRAMLEAAGHSVHVATSPHLVRYNERIRIAGRLIDDVLLAALLAEVLDAAAGLAVSFFEVTMAASFLAFARHPADACVIEVGLGGRLDASNILVAPAVCGIASLGIDHEAFLLAPKAGTPSNPLARIAFEKAGIAKRGVPLVTQHYPQTAGEAIAQVAHQAGAELFMRDQAWRAEVADDTLVYADGHGPLTLPLPSLAGAHQADNAALAVAILRHQDLVTVSPAAMAAGIRIAHWPARLQLLGEGPLTALVPGRKVWLDGGHNPDAGAVIARHFAGAEQRQTRHFKTIQNRHPKLDLGSSKENMPRSGSADRFPYGMDATASKASWIPDQVRNDGKIHLIIGMLANKDPAAILAPLAGKLRSVTVVPIPGHDAHPPEAYHAPAISAQPDVASALSALPPAGDVLIAGSLYLAGEVLRLNREFPD